MAPKRKTDTDDSDKYTTIKVVRNEDLYQHIGRDVIFGLVDHLKVASFQILNSTSFYDFSKMVPKQSGVPMQFPRFWIWSKWVNQMFQEDRYDWPRTSAEEKNQTYRPTRPLTSAEEKQPVGQLERVETRAQKPYVILFMEFAEPSHQTPVFHPQKAEDGHILLFFKLYDPEKEDVRYVGKLSVNGSDMPGDIRKQLAEMANFAPSVELNLYKETTLACDLVDKRYTFRVNNLKNGDILWFQKAPPVCKPCSYRDVPCFLKYILRSQSQAIQEAKSKVNNKKNELQKAEASVIGIKNELKELEEVVIPLEAKLYL